MIIFFLYKNNFININNIPSPSALLFSSQALVSNEIEPHDGSLTSSKLKYSSYIESPPLIVIESLIVESLTIYFPLLKFANCLNFYIMFIKYLILNSGSNIITRFFIMKNAINILFDYVWYFILASTSFDSKLAIINT